VAGDFQRLLNASGQRTAKVYPAHLAARAKFSNNTINAALSHLMFERAIGTRGHQC
jgi:hypothetical protein